MARKLPARWRRARNPEIGGRYNTPMNNHIWFRQHGEDRELWRGGQRLVTLKPATVKGHWQYSLEIGKDRSWKVTKGSEVEAKVTAKKATEKSERKIAIDRMKVK